MRERFFLIASVVASVACSGSGHSQDAGVGGGGGQTGDAASSTGGATGSGGAGGGAGVGGAPGSGGAHGPDGGAGAGGTTGTGGSAGSGGQDGGAGCASIGQRCILLTCCSTAMCDQATDTCVPPHVSDRNAKRDFETVNRDEILRALVKMPISTWSYKADESKARHIGPMAQDFMATFHVGSNDKTIFQIDADGVAFAALQSLNEQVQRLAHENAALRSELAIIRASLARVGRAPRAAKKLAGAGDQR